MRKMLNDKDNNLCKEYTIKLLNDNCSLKTIEDKIKSTFKTIIKKDSNIIELVNDFYSEEQINITYDYVKQHLKDLLFTDDDINTKYNPQINDKDARMENFVDNGTLVLKIDRSLDFSLDPEVIMKETYKIEEYTKQLEQFFNDKLHVPVRILFNDTITFN